MKKIFKKMIILFIFTFAVVATGFYAPRQDLFYEKCTENPYFQKCYYDCPDMLVLRYGKASTVPTSFKLGKVQIVIRQEYSLYGCKESIFSYIKVALNARYIRNWISVEEVERNFLWDRGSFQQILTVKLYDISKDGVLSAIIKSQQSRIILVASPITQCEVLDTGVPNDTLYFFQQSLYRRIGIEQAWGIVQENNATLRVGIMESGSVANHEDFVTTSGENRILQGNHQGVNSSHATGVAQVEMMSLSSNSEDFVDSLMFAAEKGVSIINASFVWFTPNHATGIAVPTSHSYAHIAAINRFNGLIVGIAGNGTIVRNASGNWAWDSIGTDRDSAPWLPSGYRLSNVITVGASQDSANIRAGFSNFGKLTVDIFVSGQGLFTTTLNNGYTFMSGTSFAAPLVSGTIALMLSVNPELHPQKIRDILRDSVNTNGVCYYIENHSVFGGILDAYAAVRMASQSPHTMPSATPKTSVYIPFTGAGTVVGNEFHRIVYLEFNSAGFRTLQIMGHNVWVQVLNPLGVQVASTMNVFPAQSPSSRIISQGTFNASANTKYRALVRFNLNQPVSARLVIMQNRQDGHFVAHGTNTYRRFYSYTNAIAPTTATFEFVPSVTGSFSILFASISHLRGRVHIYNTQSATALQLTRPSPMGPYPIMLHAGVRYFFIVYCYTPNPNAQRTFAIMSPR